MRRSPGSLSPVSRHNDMEYGDWAGICGLELVSHREIGKFEEQIILRKKI